MNTWMKWNTYGDASRFPVFIFVIGDTNDPEHAAAPILCTTINGTAFQVTRRFVNRLTPTSLEEAVMLANNIYEAAIVPPEENQNPPDDKADAASLPNEPEPLFFIADNCGQ
jgi:hypothetical protein